jgi:hypothetical protein
MKKQKSFALSLISFFAAGLMLVTALASGAQAAGGSQDQVCTEVGQTITIDGFQYKCYGVLKLPQSVKNPATPAAPVTPSKKAPTAKPKPALPIPKALTPCTKIGETRTGFNVIVKCAVANRKLVWQSITQHSQKVPESALYKAPPPLPPQVPAPVLIGNPAQSIAGSPISLSITGGQGQGLVSYSVAGAGCLINGNQLFSVNAGVCGVIAKKDTDGQYAPATSTFQAFTFKGQPSPLLAITKIGSTNVVGVPISLLVTGGNGNPATVFKTSTPDCSIQGNVLTSTKLTICYVTATQGQFEKYGPAVSATVGFSFASTQSGLTITPASQTVVKGTQINLATIGGAGTGEVTYKVSGSTCNLAGTVLTSSDLGSCSVVANKASDGIYEQIFSKFNIYTFVAAPLKPQDPLRITNANRTLNKNESVAIGITGGSGTGEVTYVATGVGCLVSTTGVVTTTSPVTSTTPTNCSVSARKAADKTYLVTTSNTVVFTFVKPPLGSQAPLLLNNPNVTVNTGQAIGLSISGGSGTGAVTYSAVGSGCTLSGNSVTSAIPTNCVISAIKSADTFFLVAKSNTVVFTFITPIAPYVPKPDVLEILNSNLTGLVDTPIALLATGSRGALVSYAVTSGACSIAGSNLTSTVPTECTVLAVSQAPGSTSTMYSKPVTFKFSKAVTALTIIVDLSKPLNYDPGTLVTLAASNGNGNKVSFTTATGSSCLITGQSLTSTTAAACPVQAVQLNTDGVTFTSSPVVTFNFTLAPQAPLVLSSGGVTTALALSSVPITVTGGTTDGAVTYQVAGNGCSFANGLLTANTVTSCSVSATKAGNKIYNSVTAPYLVVNFTPIPQNPLTISNSITAIVLNETSPATVTITARGGAGTAPITFTLGAHTAGCKLEGNVLSSTTTGSCAVIASRAADGAFTATQSDPVVFTFVKP